MNLIQQTVFGDDAPIVSATAPSLSPRNSIHGIRRSKLGTRERLVRRRAQLISPHVLPGIVPNERKVLDVIEELDIPHDWGHAFSFPNRKLSSRVVCIDERDDSDVLVTVPAFKSFVSCRDLDVSQSSPRHMRTKITGIGSNNGMYVFSLTYIMYIYTFLSYPFLRYVPTRHIQYPTKLLVQWMTIKRKAMMMKLLPKPRKVIMIPVSFPVLKMG